jgi:hypothetical protein
MVKKIINKRFEISLWLVLLLAIILRFFNYFNRWGLAYDQARDVIVSAYALSHHLIPLIGPFSSAGQFVYGPQWYWILMAMVLISGFTVMGPWIIQTLLFVLVVLLMYLIGKEISDKKLGLILAFLTAISTSQIGLSTNLISPAMAGIFSIISVYFFVRFIKYSKNLDAFLLAFFVGNTINIHFQAIGLLSLIPIAFLFNSKRKIKQLLILALGLFVPFIPLLIFDFKTNFFESRNFIDYYLYGQNRIYVPNRWLTYLGVFWPKTWASIIGGYDFVGYLLVISLALITAWQLITKKINKTIIVLMLPFFLIVLMLRFYKGIIFGGYTAFINPFVLILTAFLIYELFKIKKLLGIGLILLVAVFSLALDYQNIKVATNNTAASTIYVKNILIHKFPNQKFAVYDYKFAHSTASYALVLYLNKENKLSDTGKKIGFADFPKISKMRQDLPLVIEKYAQFQIYDLTSSSSATLVGDKWIFVNPSEVYKTSEQWYINNK